MKKQIHLIFLITIFALIYFFFNYFVVYNIFIFINLTHKIVFYIISFFLFFSYPIAMLLERYKPMKLTHLFYVFASIWIGIAFFSFFIFLIYKIAGLFFTIDKTIAPLITLSLVAILSIISLINAQKLKINSIEINLKGLKKELKIVHLSDLHLGTINQKKYLERVVRETNSLNPNLVVITGDLVDGSAQISKTFLSPINELKAPVYYVIGNHEIYDGLDKLMPILKQTKMKILRNEKVVYKKITFIGIDYNKKKKETINILDKIKINKKHTNILLYHEPIFKLNYLNKKGIDLHLTGHTHNGQIFPFNLLVKLLYSYSSGLYKSKNSETLVHVSPGTGVWGPPMRLGSSNKIVLINLKKK